MVWLGLVTGKRPRAHPVPYLRGSLIMTIADGCTSIHFGENQLSPGSIGISPLSTGHPPVLQHGWVRASTRSYPRFTLPMDSSPGFGSAPGNQCAPCSDSLSLRLHGSSLRPPIGAPLNLMGCRDQLAGSFYKRHAVRAGPPKEAPLPSDRLWVLGFRVSFIPLAGCFSPFPHGTCALSVARTYVRLGGWSPQLPTGFRVSRGTQVPASSAPCAPVSPTGLSPALVRRSRPLRLSPCAPSRHVTPALQPSRPGVTPEPEVWASSVPVSLATTPGLSC